MDSRHSPRVQNPIEVLNSIVRPPGKPILTRLFADVDRADAETYAADNGTVVERLPVF